MRVLTCSGKQLVKNVRNVVDQVVSVGMIPEKINSVVNLLSCYCPDQNYAQSS